MNLKLFFHFCKSKERQFNVCNLYKTRKYTKNGLSNFGLIEETMDLSRIPIAVLETESYFVIKKSKKVDIEIVKYF